MKRLVWACGLNGMLFGLVKLFYEMAPVPMTNLLYGTFLGFTVTTAVGAEWRKGKEYLGSIGVGLVWAAGYVGLEAALLFLPLPEILTKALAFGIMSFLIEAGNQFVLPRTRCHVIPLQFAVVIGIFSQQCRHVPYVLAALLIGVLAALISRQIYLEALPSKEK